MKMLFDCYNSKDELTSWKTPTDYSFGFINHYDRERILTGKKNLPGMQLDLECAEALHKDLTFYLKLRKNSLKLAEKAKKVSKGPKSEK